VDLSGNGIATNTGSLANTVQTWGTALNVAGTTTNGLIWSGRSTSATTRFTAASVFLWKSGAANNFPQLLSTSTANNGYRITPAGSGAAGSTLAIGLTKGAVASLATVTITADVPYFVITSHREDSGEYYLLLKNLITNEVSRVTATNILASLASDGNYVVGNGRRDISASWNGTIGMAYMSLDFLPETAATLWLRNPWQLFQPISRRIFVASTAGTTDTALSTAGTAVGTLAAAANLASALSGTGAAVGTLEGSTAAVTATTDLSAAAAATVTGEGAARVAVELDADGAAVGTAATASLAAANLSSTGAATATADITDAGAFATTRLDSTGAATANAVGIVTQSSDLTSTGAGTGTAATASIATAVLTSAGAAVGTLEGSAVSGYLTTDLSAAAVAVGTMAGALRAASALSAAGASTARLRGSTAEAAADTDYLTWGAQARLRQRLLDDEEEEILTMLATMLPTIRKGQRAWRAQRRTGATA
jgi:hypothetical protein